MTVDLVLQNLLFWSLQIAMLSGAAVLIRWGAALQSPRAKLAYWQATLASALFLPLLRPWKQEFANANIQISSSLSAARQTVAGDAFHLSWPIAVASLIVTGVIARLIWLAFGMAKLSRYRRTAQLLKFSGNVELCLSADITGPATFGFFHPVVLLPAGFTALDPPTRTAILEHELLNVRRRDWLMNLAEEVVCALFWFHPAIWWLVSEIRLSREQVVDFDVIAATGEREKYIDALLAVAAGPSLAPPFLQTNRVKQRIVAIVKDVPMSTTKRLSTLAAGFTMLAISGWLVTAALPLHAAPQAETPNNNHPIRVGGGVAQANLISQVRPAYPPEAKAARIQGIVQFQATISKEGNVVDLVLLSGPKELVESATTAVSQWVYRPTLLNGEPVEVITTIDINYTLSN